MYVGHTAIFQNPNQAVSDYQIYQEDMAAKYIGGYWREVVKHYEFTGEHFAIDDRL